MTTPTTRKIDPAAATTGTAEDSATGFDLALYPDAVDINAHHQGCVVSYANGDDEAVAVTFADPLPVTLGAGAEVDLAAGAEVALAMGAQVTVNNDSSSPVIIAPWQPSLPVEVNGTVLVSSPPSVHVVEAINSVGTVAVVAGDLVGNFQLDLGNDSSIYTLRSVTLFWPTALWPADAEVDVYVYNAPLTVVGFAGMTGDPWDTPIPDPGDGQLVGKVRLSNDAIGAAYGLVVSGLDVQWQCTDPLGRATFYAVLAAGTGFTTADPLRISVNYEQIG